MHLDRFRQAWGDGRTNNCALYLDPGVDPDGMTDQLRAELAREGFSLILRSNASLRNEVIRVFDNTFAITFVMQGLTAAVAFCGILSALLALLLERTRELGTLRALGMTRPQVHTMLRSEAAAMGVLATVLGSAAGLLLTFLLVLVINVRSFGWTIDLHISPGVFGAAAVIALLASLGATIWPARRLDRMALATALREE
jgi:putative ABC transport system permease protein